jgi:hypothetical protein
MVCWWVGEKCTCLYVIEVSPLALQENDDLLTAKSPQKVVKTVNK